MNTSRITSLNLVAICLAIPLFAGCAHDQPAAGQSFGSPDDAAQALANAARTDDVPRLMAIMGGGADQVLSSGDNAADRQRRQEFVSLYDQKHSLENDGDAQRTLIVGPEDWPFPVPIVRASRSKWRFDTQAGVEEILNRRVGRNELFTIQVCKAIGDAEREYALRDPEKTGSNTYAMKILSDPDRRNGLYWRTADGEEPSPLGDLVAEAAAQGYTRKEGGEPTPYHGYYYRILQSQGSHAPDGAVDYVVNGKMILGFAVLAWPAKYGNSGVMTFMMGPDGVVYQKDLGDQTATLAPAITSFDPGDGWTKSKEQDLTPAVESATAKTNAGSDDDDDNDNDDQ
jgi:hypothetical protein